MKPENIRNAFRVICVEAQNDRALTAAVSEKAVPSRVPVVQIKALFWQFVVILLPVMVLYFAVSLFPAISEPSLPEIDSAAEVGKLVFHNSFNLFAGGDYFAMWLIRAILRGFLILGVFAFILTAAAMPVKRPEEIQGGLICET